MNGLENFGKILIIGGLIIIAIGALLMLSGKISWLGRLPGDIIIQKKNFTFYFPLATSILISIFLTLILWLFFKR
ncbi:MAG: DUF2905 domain-containing protein [Thermodesulfovibrionales bacterium]|nr:DUF2905 domain-containing protein [Thermodesulfovibrionales bacterium]